MFLFDKFYQSIKKPGQFARLSFYHVLMFLVTVAYLDVEQPFKGFRQVHQVGGLAVLIHDVFGEEQTAYHFHAKTHKDGSNYSYLCIKQIKVRI